MNPYLNYAQAIPGVSSCRGIGILDTLHLIEIPPAIEAMQKSPAFPKETHAALKQWFGDNTEWMLTLGNAFLGEGGSDELPPNCVYVSAFYMDKCEVTKALWDDARHDRAQSHGREP